MHQTIGAHDIAAIDLTDRLVAEADAKNRCGGSKFADEFERDACFVGCAGAGRDADAFRLECFHLVHRDHVIAENFHLRSKLAEILDEVVGEGVVVIEDEEHLG